MDTWSVLYSELKYYGIKLIKRHRCQSFVDGQKVTHGIFEMIKNIKKEVEEKKNVLKSLLEEVMVLLDYSEFNNSMIDERMTKLFVYSLKDLSKFLMCFDEMGDSKYSVAIASALNRDIKSFSKDQIYKFPDYKISIDYVHRLICRMQYVIKLLKFSSLGQKVVNQKEIKLARGISGPWANLDLPMEERVFDFGDEEMGGRVKDKQKQRRNMKSLRNRHNNDFVGEGHNWREVRNEPYSWSNRKDESPYQTMKLFN